MKHLFIISALAIILFSFGKIMDEKKFSVSFTQSEWEARYNWIETAKDQLKRSDLPSKTVVFINDSLLGKFQNDLANQLRPQFIAAADTTKKKSK